VSGGSLEVTQKTPMINGRGGHGSVYHSSYLYVIGGYNGGAMRECERLLVSEDRWEAFQPLPKGSFGLSAVVVKRTQCLFALGGSNEMGMIQRLSLGRLEWDAIPLRFPTHTFGIAIFKQDETRAFFVGGEELYCLNALTESSITLIKHVGEIKSWYGPSYYHGG